MGMSSSGSFLYSGNRSVAVPVYLLEIPCGPLTGSRSYPCDGDGWGKNVTFQCPNITYAPSCVFYNESSGAWEGSGVGPASYNDTSGTFSCATSHLTDFASRFSALADEQVQVFSGVSSLGSGGGSLASQPQLVVVLVILFAFFCAVLWHAAELDAHGSIANFRALAQQKDVVLLAHLETALHPTKRFILDAFLQDKVEASLEAIAAVGGVTNPTPPSSPGSGTLSKKGIHEHPAFSRTSKPPRPSGCLGTGSFLAAFFGVFSVSEDLLKDAPPSNKGSGEGGEGLSPPPPPPQVLFLF